MIHHTHHALTKIVHHQMHSTGTKMAMDFVTHVINLILQKICQLLFGWAKEEYPLKDNRQPQAIPVEGVKYTGIRSIDPDVCKLYGIQIQTGPKGEDVTVCLQVSTYY